FPELKKRGIKTIVNLRTSNSDRGRADKYGIAGVHIPVNASSPRKEDFAVFLKIATDPARQPVFVHCRHGADRTGAAVALYRIYVQGWTKDEAIEEMTRGGYGFHALFSSLKDFIRKF
ncbi:MAG TPA: tyrosine-protein phosphatase, partial [Spirochaetota bacterium]|nr:tyrosine-protein phosphatase [Spirochaetota bacterium]